MLGVAAGFFSALVGQVLVLAGLVGSFLLWSWWPLVASFLTFAIIHAAISAWTTPVAIVQPRSVPKLLKLILFLLVLSVAFSAVSLSTGLLRWPN
jgi:hypothetical protein